MKIQKKAFVSLLFASLLFVLYYIGSSYFATGNDVLPAKIFYMVADWPKSLLLNVDNSSISAVTISEKLKEEQEWCYDVHVDENGSTKTCKKENGSEKILDPSKQVALGGGITSVGFLTIKLNKYVIRTILPIFTSLLPSFCRTCTAGYHYHFYWAYDFNDPYFMLDNNLKDFGDVYMKAVNEMCPNDVKVSLHMVQCSHFAKPAWAQNDAMMEAYIDNMEYFYRVNDDTELTSPGWTEAFIETLARYEPSNVGVVGPMHTGGNEGILTYDFTHKTHITVFGFHYPRVLTDWFADDWVTKVYTPGRSTKLQHIQLKHTLQMGQRYKNDLSKGPVMKMNVARSKAVLRRYIKYRESLATQPAADGKKVIAMGLYGSDSLFTYGALRNAQLAPIHFPGWSLRLYVPAANSGWPEDMLVPQRMLSRLRLLGAELVFVHRDLNVQPRFFPLIVADNSSIDYFVIRDVRYRLSDRDFEVVSDWINADYAFHCIRDHPSHSSHAIVSGLWGAKRTELLALLGQPMLNILQLIGDEKSNISMADFLRDAVWPKVQNCCYCHDSVSCDAWPGSVNLPKNAADIYSYSHYLGEQFDVFQVPFKNGSSNASLPSTEKRVCTGPQPRLSVVNI